MKFSNYVLFCDECKKYGIEYAIRHTAKLGFDAVEFLSLLPSQNAVYKRYDSGTVAKLLSEYSLHVSCVSAATNLMTDDWECLRESIFRYIDFASDVKSPRFHHTLVPVLELDENSKTYAEIFETVARRAVEIARYCEKKGILCLYEPQGMYFNGVFGLSKILERVKSECKNVAVCGDVGNPLFADSSAAEIYKAFKNDIKYVHLKDYKVSDTYQDGALKSRSGKYLTLCELGQGVTDFEFVFKTLAEIGYDGEISLEYETEDLEKVREYIKKVM